MAVNRTTIAGPFHGITTDIPPTVDPQGFEDVVNFISWKGRLRTRPGLDIAGQFSPPDGNSPLNMTSFEDSENFFHTMLWTRANVYMITPGPTFNVLSLPVYIQTAELVNGGQGYSVNDQLDILQDGSVNGTMIVTAIASGPVTAVTLISSAGTGYTPGDVLNLIQSGSSNTAQVVVNTITGGGATGPIGTVTIVNSGSLYTSATGVGATGGTGTGAVFSIASGGVITNTTLNFGGAGYAVGDTLTLTQAPGGGSVIQVTSVAGGIITGYIVLDGGAGYSIATSIPVTGGTGTGALFNITGVSAPTTGGITSAVLDDPGSGYTTANNLPTSGGTGTGATVDIVGTTISSLGGSGSTGLPYAVLKAQNCVYFCNGSVPLMYSDGESSLKIAGNVPGACRFLTANAGQLLGAYWTEPDPTQPGAITYPQRLRGSDVDNFNEWNPALLSSDAFQSEIPDVPDNITGLSTIGYYSYVYRTNGITTAVPTGQSAEPFALYNIQTAPKGEGCVYPYSLASYKNIDRFIGNYDVYSFDGNNLTPIMDGKCNAEFFNDLNNASGVNQVRGIITPVLDNGFPFIAYMITIPGANVAWVLNIADGCWTRFAWNPPDTATSGAYDLQFVEQVYLT
jgi:hypothetical protein